MSSKRLIKKSHLALWLMSALVMVLWTSLPASAQSARDRRDPVRVKSDAPAARTSVIPFHTRAAPANDNFANAHDLGATLPVSHVVASFDESTIEIGEPIPACKNSNNSSVWFKFTPAESALVTLDGFGTQPDNLDVIAGVYTGTSLETLSSVACNDDFDFDIVYYPFIKGIPMTAGVTYYIQIIELNNFEAQAGASVTVTLRQTPAALNVTVNTTADTLDAVADDGQCADSGGFCSLRAAIMEANRALPGSVITIPAGTYVRTIFDDLDEGVASEGDLDINESMTITGAGAEQTIIDANTFDGVFEVFQNITVSISGMTIKGGNRGYAGGGVRINLGPTVTLNDVNVVGNTARDGAGVYVRGGTVNITNSSLVNNTINLDDPGFGSGLSVYYHFSNPIATGGHANLNNVTISGNLAQRGGGVAIGDDSSANFEYVTIAANRALDQGGGLYLSINDEGFGDGTANLGRTIVASNTSDTDVAPDCRGDYGRFARNLIGNISDCTIDINDTTGVNALLRPLELRGPGKTYTHGLQTGSPAIDALTSCGTITTDQRGVGRPKNSNCDIGALERDARLPLPFDLIAPEDEAYVANLAAIGAFTWSASNEDIFGYAFTITNIGVTPNVEVFRTIVGSSACVGGTCSYTPPVSLPDNYYQWSVSAAYDGDAATPTPRDFQIDVFAGFPNLVNNPSFENGNTGWKRVNTTGDAAKCTTSKVTIPATDGNCAFLFKGSSTENLTVTQVIPFAALGLKANDVLRLTFDYHANAKTNLTVKLQVGYKPKNMKPSIANFKVVNTGGVYQPRLSELVLKSDKVKAVKIIIKHKSKSGKSYLDKMRLIHIPAP